MDKVEAFFARRGRLLVVVGRFVEGVRQLMAVTAGISDMSFREFMLWTSLGAVLWTGVWLTLGYVAGGHVDAISKYSTYFFLLARCHRCAVGVAACADHSTRTRRLGDEVSRRQGGPDPLPAGRDGTPGCGSSRGRASTTYGGPLVPTGTNLLGWSSTAQCRGGLLRRLLRPAVPGADALGRRGRGGQRRHVGDESESREDIIGLYRRVWVHADATIDALDLRPRHGAVVAGGPRHPTLHWVLVHEIAELNRHAGQADIVRELVDGAVGLRDGVSNLPDEDAAWWSAYHEKLQRAAAHFR